MKIRGGWVSLPDSFIPWENPPVTTEKEGGGGFNSRAEKVEKRGKSHTLSVIEQILFGRPVRNYLLYWFRYPGSRGLGFPQKF